MKVTQQYPVILHDIEGVQGPCVLKKMLIFLLSITGICSLELNKEKTDVLIYTKQTSQATHNSDMVTWTYCP